MSGSTQNVAEEFTCKDTYKHVGTIKEEFLAPPSEKKLCEPETPEKGKRRRFSKAAEDEILNGIAASSGKIPIALSNEQVQLNNYHLKVEDQTNIGLLLCGALNTQDAYANLNYCLALTLVSESAELPKILSELTKLAASSGGEFPKIAELIKKTYDQICITDKAFNSMKACIDKVCNKEDKITLKDELTRLDDLEDCLKKLKTQAEEAVMSVIQSASIFAQHNLPNLESVIAEIKPQAERFKKDVDENASAASKSAAEWQKKYAESITSIAQAHSEYGKASSAKTGKESAYCFIDQSRAEMKNQKAALLEIFDPTNKNATSNPREGKSGKSK
ncbi:hypothetical protein [Haliscomenobacter sp.]|uniref:hypothetical protein n=1 Tax=Haliscomenobacter sp. TaxID=2717303 RepID=UPI003BABA365